MYSNVIFDNETLSREPSPETHPRPGGSRTAMKLSQASGKKGRKKPFAIASGNLELANTSREPSPELDRGPAVAGRQ